MNQNVNTRDFSTYAEEFEFDMNELLRGPNDIGDSVFFHVWLERAVFHCEKCGNEFEMRRGEVEADNFVFCSKCRKT